MANQETLISLEKRYRQDIHQEAEREITARRGFGWEISREFEYLVERANRLDTVRNYLKKPKGFLFGYKCPECNQPLRKTKLSTPSYSWYSIYFECKCGYEYGISKNKILYIGGMEC